MRAIFCSLFLCLGLALPALAQQAPLIPTDATYAVIYDHEADKVLYAKRGDDSMVPASMTKIMTAQVVFERLKTGELTLEDRITVSENAWRKGGWASGGSTMGLQIGDQPTVAELLRGVIVLSGNDACIALAEGISGSEAAFAEEMTALAQRMGLSSASFRNATGLDEPGHRISAVDLARLASQQIREFPELYKLYAETSYEWRGIRQPNRNPLLSTVEGADGIKTGHLSVSGYGLTGSAVRAGARRIIVINGLENEAARAREAERLMRTAFTAFETRRIPADGDAISTVDVYLGQDTRLDLVLVDPIEVTLHKRAMTNARAELVYDGPLVAPIAQGDVVGHLEILVDGEVVARAPVAAAHEVERIGLFGRVVEGLRVKMQGP